MSDVVIKVVPEDFESAYTELKTLGTSLDAYRAALEESYSSMQAGWTGAAADAFDAHVPKLLKDYTTLASKMEQIAEDIRQAGALMQETDRRLTDAIGE